ncbi:unnamed protein product [Angiostrongylus costaricensis]|uniref:Penicillin-binding protein n=1 Tax=Angiostrongylus costaricensis TaxID=334426 RepID=A0A0R3Q1L7_ANGCS|nr:unnamed protein product [Angiostrongylus costaricensis]
MDENYSRRQSQALHDQPQPLAKLANNPKNESEKREDVADDNKKKPVKKVRWADQLNSRSSRALPIFSRFFFAALVGVGFAIVIGMACRKLGNDQIFYENIEADEKEGSVDGPAGRRRSQSAHNQRLAKIANIAKNGRSPMRTLETFVGLCTAEIAGYNPNGGMSVNAIQRHTAFAPQTNYVAIAI